MTIPAVYINPETSTVVQVKDAFAAALDEDLLRNICDITCNYDLISDSVRFQITRMRDKAKVRLEVRRDMLRDTDCKSVVRAFKNDPEAFAKLILFLA